ncbi:MULTISPECIES: hypothetical protein [Caproicibacterium]|uniref:DUF2190 family protein n=1 Tax=Caproicibacterium argilliputei TaxID=3030016 RepID=A0AA97DDF9_9FIRM|nr:hypothetical protein [Caproicibacterium argilliputei]WOC33473.1 hypothetical protein PXC00_06295 [Caproicibacterium argilliputei]
MATYMGTGVSDTQTITLKAAADVTDIRGLAIVVDSAGKAAVAAAAAAPIVGIALLCSGASNTLDGKDGAIKAGEDVDILIKDCGYAIAGAAIITGAELTATTDGKVFPLDAATGGYVVGTALESANAGERVFVQITKYFKPKA